MTGVAIPNDWTELDGYISVFFCMPNSPQWRRIVVGHIEGLSYGRYWNRETGTITEAQEIAGKMFETMQICDIETQLSAIANNTADIAERMPRLYTLAELEAAFDQNPVIDWEQVSGFFEVLGILPGIKFDPLALIFQFLWRAQILAQATAMSTAQTAIASALAKGLGIEAIEAGLEGLDNGRALISDIIEGTTDIITTAATIATLFKDDQEGQQLKVLNDIAISLQVNCTGCGQAESSCLCNPEVSGPIAEEAAISVNTCCVPEGFLAFSEYDSYACKVANWLGDKSALAMKQLELLHYRFFDDYDGINSENRLGPTQIYQRMSAALSDIFTDSWLFTVPNDERANVTTILTDRYVQFQQEVIDTVPETQTTQQVIDKWFSDTFNPVVVDLESTLDADKQNLFDQDTAIATHVELINNLLAAAALAGGQQPTDVADILNSMVKPGLANIMYYKNLVVDLYQGEYVCLGSKCTCPDVYEASAQRISSTTWQSVVHGQNPARHVLDLIFNYDGQQAQSCGPNVFLTVLDIQGWTEWNAPDFETLDGQGSLIYQGDGPWPTGTEAKEVRIDSGSPFSITLTWRSEGC